MTTFTQLVVDILDQPTQEEIRSRIKLLLSELNTCMDNHDVIGYYNRSEEIEFFLQYLSLSKIIKMGHDLGGLTITTNDSPFKRWFFYLFDTGANITLRMHFTVDGKVHTFFIDKHFD